MDTAVSQCAMQMESLASLILPTSLSPFLRVCYPSTYFVYIETLAVKRPSSATCAKILHVAKELCVTRQILMFATVFHLVSLHSAHRDLSQMFIVTIEQQQKIPTCL